MACESKEILAGADPFLYRFVAFIVNGAVGMSDY